MQNSLLVHQASMELELLRPISRVGGDKFPVACRKLVRSLPGNNHCLDCGAPNPAWASVSYGCLLCLRCSGKHRSYGVQTSKVRSLDMDHWTHEQVLAMLEGGNAQIAQFFERHSMGNATLAANNRYHTKASLFYRTHLSKHVESVASAGAYQGREASRRSNAGAGAASSTASSAASSSQSSHHHHQIRAVQQVAKESSSRRLPVVVQMC
jgi:Putative GTPase activating protein for Arf